jgi:gamma-glutamylcyclotransferase (GGCT)/AIG2-like uncharacterized protein YtfP
LETLSLFVYGSLLPGQPQFDKLDHAVVQRQPMRLPGYLRLRPDGYPALVVHSSCPQQVGEPYHWELPECIPADSPEVPVPSWVDGELLTLRDDADLRHALDDSQGFAQKERAYVRVAVYCHGRWQWTYAGPQDYRHWPRISSWAPASN